METKQFVLACCVFIIVAGWLVSMPDLLPVNTAPQTNAGLTCRFDNYCAGTPCRKAPAPDFTLSYESQGSWTLLTPLHTTDSVRLMRHRGDSGDSYRPLEKPDALAMEVTIATSGAMRLEQRDASGAVVAFGEGHCSGEQVRDGTHSRPMASLMASRVATTSKEVL